MSALQADVTQKKRFILTLKENETGSEILSDAKYFILCFKN